MSSESHPDEVAIAVRGVGKVYRSYSRPIDRLLQMFSKKQRFSEFAALADVSFTLHRGEALGILGPNGAGKSTLLQIVAGTMAPTCGEVIVNGRVSALLELGSGFNPDYTGRENVFLNGAILGIEREEMLRRFDEIAAFAGIGEFIDQPVKTYSSGMQVRLAFAVAISVSPEILIVDEALSVGDIRFQQRCASRIRELREAGVTILLVTHDTEAVRRICGRALVIEHGKVVREGLPGDVCNWYLAHMVGEGLDTDGAGAAIDAIPDAGRDFRWLRHGDGNAEIIGSTVIGPTGTAVVAVERDAWTVFQFDVRFAKRLDEYILGFFVRDRLGADIIGINTFQEHVTVPSVEVGDVVRFEFRVKLQLKPGAYGVSPGLAYTQHEMKYLDWVNNAVVFKVVDPEPNRAVFGVVHPDVEVEVSRLGGQQS